MLGGAYEPLTVRVCAVKSFNINHVILTQPWVSAAQVARFEVFAWTVNEVSAIERMVDIGVDAIVTDFPDRVPGRIHRTLGSSERPGK